MLSDPANPMNIPEPTPFPGTDVPIPFYVIGDGAFPLATHMMKPFAQQGLLLKPIETTVEHSDMLVKACCVLHNYLIDEGVPYYPLGASERQYAEQLQQAQIRRVRANRAPATAEAVRNHLVRFFNGVGAVNFQNEYAHV